MRVDASARCRPAPSPLTVGDWISSWLPTLAGTVVARTAQNYGQSVRSHLLPCVLPSRGLPLSDVPLRDLTRRDVREVLDTLFATGRERPTVKNCFLTLSSCLAAAALRQHIDDNPAHGAARGLVKRSRPGHARRRAITQEQLARFLAAAERLCLPQLADLYYLLAFTGLRIGEGVALEPQHVDLATRQLHVMQQLQRQERPPWGPRAATQRFQRQEICPPKGGLPRTVDLDHHLCERLAHRVAHPQGRWLFPGPRAGSPFLRNYTARETHRVAAAAGLPAGFRTHDLRHTRATFLLDATDCLYVQRQLGHASVTLTCDLYGAAAAPRRLEVIDRIGTDFQRMCPAPRRAANRSVVDERGPAWAIFLAAWHAAHGDRAVTTADLLRTPTVRTALPAAIASALASGGTAAALARLRHALHPRWQRGSVFGGFRLDRPDGGRACDGQWIVRRVTDARAAARRVRTTLAVVARTPPPPRRGPRGPRGATGRARRLP